MNHEACLQFSARSDGRVADRNTANGVALALNLFASFAPNGSGYARTENQIVVRGVHDGVRVHLGQVALLNDDSFCERFHGEFSSFSGRLGLFLNGSLLRVIVDTAARFAAETPLLHVLAQQGIGTILLSERAMQILKNIEPHVEAYKIYELERTHRMIEAQLQRFVDVLRGCDAGFEHVEGFVANQRIDARGDESGSLVDDHNFLAHATSDFAASGNRRIGSMRRPDKLDQLHFWHRIEKVHTDAAIP